MATAAAAAAMNVRRPRTLMWASSLVRGHARGRAGGSRYRARRPTVCGPKRPFLVPPTSVGPGQRVANESDVGGSSSQRRAAIHRSIRCCAPSPEVYHLGVARKSQRGFRLAPGRPPAPREPVVASTRSPTSQTSLQPARPPLVTGCWRLRAAGGFRFARSWCSDPRGRTNVGQCWAPSSPTACTAPLICWSWRTPYNSSCRGPRSSSGRGLGCSPPGPCARPPPRLARSERWRKAQDSQALLRHWQPYLAVDGRTQPDTTTQIRPLDLGTSPQVRTRFRWSAEGVGFEPTRRG